MEDFITHAYRSGEPEPEWKRRLRDEFESVLAGLDAPPEELQADDDDEDESVDQPDLYSFFEELTVLRNEFRKGNRRTAETFSQIGDSLGGLEGELGHLRHHLQILGETSDPRDAPSRNVALSILEFDDRLRRLQEALQSPPHPRETITSQLAVDWSDAWEEVRQAVEMLTYHLSSLLEKLGLQPMTVIGQPFDPTLMRAVARESAHAIPPNTVIEELTRGYLKNGEPLRLAEVIVSTPPESEKSFNEQPKRYIIT
jgi:molecular chaperone GrpE (heat shock protein)